MNSYKRNNHLFKWIELDFTVTEKLTNLRNNLGSVPLRDTEPQPSSSLLQITDHNGNATLDASPPLVNNYRSIVKTQNLDPGIVI